MSGPPRASVHLWVALEHSTDELVLTAACHGLMTDEELRRESRFAYGRDRSTYRLARALTRSVLARYVDADPRCLVFARSPHGRPSILHPRGSDLDFSISHTPGIALLLVASGRTVGVDVEKVTRSAAIGAVSRMFASSELADLQARSGEDRRRRFLQYWTLKESYAKARGGGLSLPLNQCRFKIDAHDETVTATIDAALDPKPDDWSFALATPAPGFLAALTVSRDKRLGAPPLEIREARLQSGQAARPAARMEKLPGGDPCIQGGDQGDEVLQRLDRLQAHPRLSQVELQPLGEVKQDRHERKRVDAEICEQVAGESEPVAHAEVSLYRFQHERLHVQDRIIGGLAHPRPASCGHASEPVSR